MDSKSSGLSISSLAAGGSCQSPRSPPVHSHGLCRKEVGLNRWLNVSGVTRANWLPRSLCSETLAIFSWQQPHAGACTFASKHIGRPDSKNMQKWYHLKNRFGKSIFKKQRINCHQSRAIESWWIMLLFWSHRVQFTPSLFLSWVATWNGLGQLNGLEQTWLSVPFGKKSGNSNNIQQ